MLTSTSATKLNGISITMPYWDERVKAMAASFPQIKWDQYHIDILTAQFVLNPDRFDVVVASNLFGDILSDLGPACTGTIGIAPSGNINPERKFPSLFEPVHGSAPDIAGQGIANPVGQIWSGAMMLEHLGESEAARAIVAAIEKVLPDERLRTGDLKGTADTVTCGKAIAAALGSTLAARRSRLALRTRKRRRAGRSRSLQLAQHAFKVGTPPSGRSRSRSSLGVLEMARYSFR